MGNLLVLSVLLIAVFFAARSIYRQKKAGGCAGCSSSCGSCSGHCKNCQSAK